MLIINTDEPTLFVTFVFFQHKIVRVIFWFLYRNWFYAEFLFSVVEEEEEEEEEEVDIEEEVGLKTLMEQDPDLSKVNIRRRYIVLNKIKTGPF